MEFTRNNILSSISKNEAFLPYQDDHNSAISGKNKRNIIYGKFQEK